MYERLIAGLILVIAVIHLLPLSGFFGVERIAALYDIKIDDANVEILMRHRAILFGILGVFFVYAAFTPAVQPLAFVAAFISLASFFFLSFSVGDFNAAIRKVVVADVIASGALGAAILLYFINRGG